MNGWLPDPTLLPTPDGDLAAYATDYLNISCSCNSLTGPCAHHREEMRVQFLGFMSSPQNEPNMGSQKKAFANPMGDVLLDKLMQQPLPSPPLFPEMQTPVDQGRHTGFHTSNVSSSTSGSASPRDGPGNTTTATNTSRFKAILTFVRAAGFPDFDSMVTSYYTSSFQKNSVADLAQRSSRGRKLGSVLENLHESASKWTVWESRQYREKVVEAAQSMYIQELDQVIKRARRRQQQQQSMPSSAHSQQDVLMFGADECSEASVSSAASMESMAGGAMPPLPEEMGRVFQDNVSYSSTNEPVFIGTQVLSTVPFELVSRCFAFLGVSLSYPCFPRTQDADHVVSSCRICGLFSRSWRARRACSVIE